ncbi:hypothetical protein [Aureliella helgolandensis]|uniref:Uncharacterized protein n=1 Tax=Aureliella helgolandensis TaxID=2527968 RepID=A0A518GCM5_9BACT|nr:hypothetical protein [Aureliella helgolandensis]QDV26349.1 hypothetical protein Q31a_47220 [Aureliella helgolandensis]
MPLATPDEYIQVSGKVEILCAYPNAYTDLYKIGESENGISVRKIPMLGDVSGDRYGGQSGRPIERQFFGLAAEFQLNLSRWSKAEIAKLEQFGGILETPGYVPLSTIGALVHRDHGIRFLLYCVKDPTMSLNFPCCIWTQPQEQNRGTKYANCSFNVAAERAPEGFWASAKAGVVYDTDTSGIPGPYTPT